jgi:hypothetical protein
MRHLEWRTKTIEYYALCLNLWIIDVVDWSRPESLIKMLWQVIHTLFQKVHFKRHVGEAQAVFAHEVQYCYSKG